ncbi:CPCC family cysteine-rich protein [Leptospira barantonii]|uniref:Hydrolase n=1 Tax=Leptospira barantonii TaxID=2023184 RepID=A0ABX4NT84_9LEPT|nr:hydrolase [Leptospira barantonii]
MSFPCPCCGYLTFEEESGSFEICPVCYWENDNVQNDDPSYSGGANRISLELAKENYIRFGAKEKDYVTLVRKPKEDEYPEP